MLRHSACARCRVDGPVVCPSCALALAPAPSLAPPHGADTCAALLHYSSARSLVTSLKNGDRRDLVSFLADAMSELVEVPASATVTWAPTSAARRRSRGFDHAELLARAVARRCGLQCRPLLRRGPGPAQAGRTASERRLGPSFASLGPCPKTVLLVDDVITTGSTVTAAARALRAAGTEAVMVLVAARSPGRTR